MLKELRKRMKIIKTGNLYLSMFTLGLSISLSGPCLLDLQHMVHTDSEHIAMIYTVRSIGYLIGAIIVGMLLDLVRSKTSVLMLCTFLVSVTMFGIPWSNGVNTLMCFMCVNGFTLGAIETGGNVLCLQLWGKESTPIFQGLYFTYGLGSLISPLLAAPFLKNHKEFSHNANNETHLEEQLMRIFSNNFTNLTNTSDGITKIIYPFTIVGVFALLVSIQQLLVCVIFPTEERKSKDTDKKDNSDRSLFFMFFTTIFIFLVFFFVTGSQIGYAQTLTTFAVKGKLHLTTRVGSYMTSAFWAAFTLSRLASVFLSLKVSCFKLVICDICLMFISAVMLLLLMPNEWALWLASVTFGTGNASAYAAMVGWLNDHIVITNKISAIFSVGGAAGEMMIPFIITYFIDSIPDMFTYVMTSSSILLTVFLLALYCMFRRGIKIKGPKDIKCYVVNLPELQKERISTDLKS